MSKSLLVFDEKQRVAEWVAEQMPGGAKFHDYYAMGAEVNGRLTCGIVFENLNGHNANVHIAVSTPSKLFLKLLDHAYIYAFVHCGLQRVTGLVEADNLKAYKLDMKIGFEVEAVMKSAGSSGQDVFLLVLWPENYRGVLGWEKAAPQPQITVH